MSPPNLPQPEPRPTASRHDVTSAIIAGAAVLALLYFGRPVLVPITLALLLSLVVAPLVRALRRTGLNQVPAVIIAGATLSLLLIGLVTLIGFQVVQLAASLPQYESTIHSKAEALRGATIGRLEAVEGEARKVTNRLGEQPPETVGPSDLTRPSLASATGAVPVEIRAPEATAFQLIGQLLSPVLAPLQTAGIVLVVLLFVLLEHESLRDRFIRLAGESDLRSTTVAINDAGERLSRFFLSQFAVNFGVGAVLWAGLAAIGLPHAALWGALTAVLRFVPYVGLVASALAAGLLAAAVDPGWFLMVMTLGLYALVETIASQVVEPQLYGHTTGLSPLSIVVAAIFWSSLWGPIGLIVSTPLTLCLVVAGRHVKALGFLDVLLGDAPALTMAQKFYQRALTGDANEIISAARVFLKRKSFAAYCDQVLMRALHLGAIDLAAGTIAVEQQHAVRSAIVRVVETLAPESDQGRRRPPRNTVLDDLSAGRQLRQKREVISGRWQGSVAPPAGSVAICIGLGSTGDDLATEILVRILRDIHIDARHLSIEDFEEGPPPETSADVVSLVCIVSVAPDEEEPLRRRVALAVRQRNPAANVLAVLLRVTLDSQEETHQVDDADVTSACFQEAAQYARARFGGSPGGAT